mgnify:CR=1 FL=1
MKRFLLSTVIALMALCASAAIGDTFSVGKLNYLVTSNGTTEDYPQVTVTGLSAEGKAKSSLNLQIQSTVLYNGTRYRVTEIGSYAFYAQKNLVTLWVRWGITRIKNNAFQSCTNLTQARLASSVDYIESLAFNNCSSLKYVFCANDYIKDSNYASNCMPNNSGMVLLVSNTAKNTVERAKGIAAFKNFATIYRNHEAFDFAFTDGGYYVASNLPDEKPNKNRHGVFKLVGLNSSNTEYAPTASSYTVDGYTYDLAEVTYNACESYSNLKTVDLSRLSYLRAIKDYAFKGCSALTTIKLNSSTSLIIYSEAFANCTSLTTLNLTSNVYDIGASAVNGCSNLKTITVSTLNKHLCDVNGIVYSKDKTKLVRCPPGHNTTIFNHSSFPSTLKEIGFEAFATCKKIQMIHIPYGVKSIRMCFQECTGLTTLQIPSSVTDFGYGTFGFIPNLTYLYCNLSTPPSGMPYGPYSSAPRLTLYVPDEAIEAYKNARYWSTWKYIKGGAFDVTTNDAMQTLRYTIHSNKAETINGNSYAGRAMLVYAPDPTVYSQTYAVPDHVTLANGKKYAVTAINSNVCSGGMRASATLRLGANVDSIFSNAFQGKTMLTGLKLNSKLTYIGVNAFYDCRIANDLALPYGFKKLSSGAFYNNSFKRFLIPGSLISMGHTCLARNNYLEELVINDPYWARSTSWDLTKIPTSCKLYVPVGSVEAYKNNEKWGKLKVMAGSYDFTYNNADPNKTIYHMTVTSGTPLTVDGVTYAGKAKYVYHPANMTLESPTAFDCTNSEIDMTNGGSKKYLMTEFGDSALIWCEQLTNVRVERMDHLERIGNRAFCGTKITQFTVPASCSHIGNMAFSACSKLSELMLMRNQNRTYGRLFYQLNATNFNCYINWKDHYNLYLDVSKWPTSPYRPDCKDQLNGWVQINDGSTVSTFVVYHPVDWEASGLNAYIVDGYDKNKKIASTMKMGRTSTANGVLIEGYKQNVIYKLKRPITEPTNPGNYLQGTVTSENLDQYKVAYVFDKKDKYFWKPSSGYRSEAGSAFLRLTSTQAGNTTKVYIDRWYKASGDINGDGEINVSDVTALINKILGSSTYSDASCDINGDGEINVSDVTALINLILK